MKREIKFRFLRSDISNNKFWEYRILPEDFYNDDWSDLMSDMTTLSEYTNLKDENNREIYEGDIMQFGGLRLKVEWGGEGWQPFLNGGDEMSNGQSPEHGEVIGNIFENKDLVK